MTGFDGPCEQDPPPPPSIPKCEREGEGEVNRDRDREREHPLPEHPSEEGSGRFDLFVGFSHQLHGLLLFAGVVHGEPGLPLAERWEENRPMFRSGRRGERSGAERSGGEEGDVSAGADAERLQLFFYGERGRSFAAHCHHLLDKIGKATVLF